MEKADPQRLISIIYANRNREPVRIKASLDTLKKQEHQNFEVIFVDYGSDSHLVPELEEIIRNYNFTRFFQLKVSQVLWNKSKALNFGIKQTNTPYVFIADVDLLFHPMTTNYFEKIASLDSFSVFGLNYLSKKESEKVKKSDFTINELTPNRFGLINGMILVSKVALEKIHGLDEFFHFYGAEDEDLFSRLETAGFQMQRQHVSFFYHNWHQSFAGSEDEILTTKPRVKNIMRINQQHYLRNRINKITKPQNQSTFGEIRNEKEIKKLTTPTKEMKIFNIKAHVDHFFGEELLTLKGEIIKVIFIEDSFYKTWKYKIKKFIGKQSQPYYTIKEVNDIILKEILFRYRNWNYSFEISQDLKSIKFCLEIPAE